MIKEEIPLAYLPGGVARVHIRVVGDLAEPTSVSPGTSSFAAHQAQPTSNSVLENAQEYVPSATEQDAQVEAASSAAKQVPQGISAQSEDCDTWEQQVRASDCHSTTIYVFLS